MSAEKNLAPEKSSQDTPPIYAQGVGHHENKIGISEGADLYGDVATAEDYGYVARGYDAILLHGKNDR